MKSKLRGAQPWLVVLANTSDRTPPSVPGVDYFRSFVEAGGGGLYDFWSDISGRRMDLAGSRVVGWHAMSETSAQVNAMSRGAAAQRARAAAGAAGVDVSGYRYTLAFIAGSVHFGGGAGFVVSSVRETRGQPGWRWCRKCESLAFWEGTRDTGRCSGGDRHDHSGSGYYSVQHGVTITDGETGWRWCSRCETLVQSNQPSAGCPAGDTHVLGTTGYVVRRGSTGDNEQRSWRRCNRCQSLVYLDPGRGPGPCVASQRHDPAADDYSVPLAWSASLGAIGHEVGHGFGFGHAFDTGEGSLIHDAHPGAYGDWTDLMSWVNTAQFAAPRFTPAGAGLSAAKLHKLGWLDDAAVVRVNPGAGSRTVDLVALYGSAAGSRMIQAVRPDSHRIYTASFRPATGWDRGFRSARVIVHRQHTLYSVSQDHWAHCERCEGMVYGGTMICPAGGLHDGRSSSDYGLLNGVTGVGQSNWRWCSKCEGLAFAGNQTSGRCPAGGGHDHARSGDYSLETTGAGQPNWRWCRKCQGLFFAGHAVKGTCPAGGLHEAGSTTSYVLPSGTGTNRQNKWRWCNKCQGLFFAGRAMCAGGDVHRLGWSEYALTLEMPDAAGQSGWKWCSRCRGIAFTSSSRPPGPCPAGGTHAHPGGTYTMRTDAEAAAAQQGWFQCGNCNGLHFVDTGATPGRCFAANGGAHTQGQAYEVARNTQAVPGRSDLRQCSRCQCMVVGQNPAGCFDGQAHSTGTPLYTVRTAPSTLSNESAFWRVCSSCNVLMRLATADASRESSCSVAGRHTPAAQRLYLTLRNGATKWRWCRKCEVLAWWDGSRDPGPCPAGGRHDHAASGFYYPPHLEEAVQVVAPDLQQGGVYEADSIRFEVVALTEAAATVRVTS